MKRGDGKESSSLGQLLTGFTPAVISPSLPSTHNLHLTACHIGLGNEKEVEKRREKRKDVAQNLGLPWKGTVGITAFPKV